MTAPIACCGNLTGVERESGYYTRITGGQADVVALLGAAETPIVSFGAMLGTMIVAYTSVMQRRTEIGVLRALGFQRRSILAAFLLESLALALAGGDRRHFKAIRAGQGVDKVT